VGGKILPPVAVPVLPLPGYGYDNETAHWA